MRILRRDIETLNAGYTRSFTIYDQDDTVRLTRNSIRDLGMDDKQLTLRHTRLGELHIPRDRLRRLRPL